MGIRELRQHLSIYLKRVVVAGETLKVTDRGRVVAIFAPLPETGTPLERLVLSGRATAPSGDLLKMGRPRGPASNRVSRALRELRDERL